MSKERSIFYHPTYLKIQEHENLKVFETEDFHVVFSIAKDLAVSLPQGLFGAVVKKQRAIDFQAFEVFWKEVRDELAKAGVTRAELIQPPDIYQGFVQTQWLMEVGFSPMYEDITHHIRFRDFELHKMEQKKLDKLSELKFSVRQLDVDGLHEAYDLLEACREEKGLKLNVTLERLEALFHAFPDSYEIFIGYLNQKPSCAVITLKVAPKIVYYFLPGTLKAARAKSPMVGLLDHIVQHYATTHQYLDLGISSIEGLPQNGLIAFKERMGGMPGMKRRFFIRV
jgi:hypothetical protein